MSFFKMPPQIVRLVLVTIVVVGTYAVARVIMTPATYYDYGNFRGAALEELQAKKPVLAGMKACDECHSDMLEKLAKYEHKGISCESCHGFSRPHADNPDVKPPKVKFADSDCLSCHQASPSRPSWLKQIEPVEHFRNDKCTGCHVPHQPKEIP